MIRESKHGVDLSMHEEGEIMYENLMDSSEKHMIRIDGQK